MSKILGLRNNYRFILMLVDRTKKSLDDCNALRAEVEELKVANKKLTTKVAQLEANIPGSSFMVSYLVNPKL